MAFPGWLNNGRHAIHPVRSGMQALPMASLLRAFRAGVPDAFEPAAIKKYE
nr:hypothetical protein [Delftia sp. PS-11]